MRFSVVIPVYNGISFLTANLPGVFQLKAAEIIIVDDASTDATAQFVTENYPQIKLFRHFHNLGFPATVNQGFAKASGDTVILLNQDVNPDKQLIKNIKSYFSDPNLFAVTFHEQDRSWARASITNGWLEYTNGDSTLTQHSSLWASGGSAAFRKSVWDELGGFDASFTPGYFEDLDLGFRAHKRGYAILWSQAAQVSHTPESTFKPHFPPRFLQRIKDRNFLWAQWKNFDTPQFWPHFLAVLDRVLQHPGYALPVLMALKRLSAILAFRKLEKPQLKLSDSEVFAQLND